jgi:site-specific DNA-methyltransferase (adenine-specific)
MEYLIKMTTREWQIVLDPFLWSWTTAVACKEMWRNFIGIEKEQKYVDIANKRLATTTISLF